ncbi:MAG: pantoate--beta-alanine ligase [Candidatus Latescibacterota bacterium]|jgi:pantoate--beta-alanine ligase
MNTPPLITTIAAMQNQADTWRRQGLRVGLVPTMGYLHDGHLSLVTRCVTQADRTVVSIFVNPLQFGPAEDYAVYPRDLERDLGLLAPHGVAAVFHPTPEEFYPQDFCTTVEVSGLTDGLCGAFRPGHFRGVTTVVTKLFTAVIPHLAVFGQKDYQQCAVIRRMTRDLNLGVTIDVAPTVREADGLAMSSRNVFLTEEERQRAPAIYRALRQAEQAFLSGTREVAAVLERLKARLRTEVTERIDYVEGVDPDSLRPVEVYAGRLVLAVAVRMSKARLIDNLVLR